MYNPYYTMVGQHMCRESHAFQITLQYCLWDFLREIGENQVGGTEMIANLDTGANSTDSKAASSSKLHNVAHAYAWWAAKGCISLGVLKVRYATHLLFAVRLNSLLGCPTRFSQSEG